MSYYINYIMLTMLEIKLKEKTLVVSVNLLAKVYAYIKSRGKAQLHYLLHKQNTSCQQGMSHNFHE